MKQPKTSFIFSLLLLTAILLSSCSMFQTDDPPPSPVESDTDSETGFVGEPSIYPEAWKQLNAVIVKWGESKEPKNDWVEVKSGTLTEGYSCVGIEVVHIYEETWSAKGYEKNLESIQNNDFLMIPNDVANELVPGETALVFLSRIQQVAAPPPGSNTVMNEDYKMLMGTQDSYKIAPIFPIEDEKVTFPEGEVLETGYYNDDPDSEPKYTNMYLMGYIMKGNRCIEKNNASAPPFTDGMSLEDLGEFFDYLCNDVQYFA